MHEERIVELFGDHWPASELRIVDANLDDAERLCRNLQSLLESHSQSDVVSALQRAKDVYQSQGWNRVAVMEILRGASLEPLLPVGVEKPLIPKYLVYALMLANTYRECVRHT